MNDFSNKKCQACSGMTEKINKEDAIVYLNQLDSAWNISEDGLFIFRKFQFKNFKQTIFFINALAFLCEKEGHHPDVKFGYNYCDILFTTHELGGLSENDFICATKVDHLFK